MNRLISKFIFIISILLIKPSLSADSNSKKIAIGDFSAGLLQPWEDKKFKGMTHYELAKLEGITALKAFSDNSASGLLKKQQINLLETPVLNWRWRIENRLENINEQTKAGDDYAARIYVIVDGGLVFWRTKAINYVWASSSAKGKVWPNAYAGDHAVMIALRSKSDNIGGWYNEKRNILNDLKQYVDKDIDHIDGIAIMTDTDDSHSKATAYYGDIFFTEN